MNKLLKNTMICSSLALLALSSALDLYAQSSLEPYCIRIYCTKDKASKVRNTRGHGQFYPALYSSQKNLYYIHPSHILMLFQHNCSAYEDKRDFYGSNAAKYETFAEVIKVEKAPAGINVEYRNQACTDKEK